MGVIKFNIKTNRYGKIYIAFFYLKNKPIVISQVQCNFDSNKTQKKNFEDYPFYFLDRPMLTEYIYNKTK